MGAILKAIFCQRFVSVFGAKKNNEPGRLSTNYAVSCKYVGF